MSDKASKLIADLLVERGIPVGSASDAERITQRFCTLLADAQHSWPDVAISAESFFIFVVERLALDQAPLVALEKLHGADLFLACACTLGDPAGFDRFERLYQPTVKVALAHFDLNPAELDEIAQQLRVKLLLADGDRPPKISQYVGRGGLASWLRVAVVREALQVFRRPRREVLMDDLAVVDALMGPADGRGAEAERIVCRHREDFKWAFQQSVASLEPRQRNILRYYHLEQLNIDQIGRLCGMHRATAARQLKRTRDCVLAKMQTLLSERLQIGESSFASIAQLIDTHLDLSLSRILR